MLSWGALVFRRLAGCYLRLQRIAALPADPIERLLLPRTNAGLRAFISAEMFEHADRQCDETTNNSIYAFLPFD